MTETTKQRTIKDAYEYFLRKNAANLPFIYNHIIYNTFDGHFYARVEGCIHSSDRLVCTREEFEDYAKKMEGKTKQKTVKDAYEYFLNKSGYEYCLSRDASKIPLRYNYIIYNAIRGDFDARVEGCIFSDDQLVCTREEFEAYAKEQEQSNKPVYTQEMADNGELPPVGSSVVLRYNFDSKTVTHTGIVLFSSSENCILATEHGESHFKIGEYIYEPIETRTDEEKLIDEVAELINDHIDDDAGSKCLAKEIINKLK